jgi:glycosyltransferase involved in cell wall biosynthesis
VTGSAGLDGRYTAPSVTSKRALSRDAERLSAAGNGRAGELAQLPVGAQVQDAAPGDEAVRAFHERYPDVRFAPVLVIIPAYNEADCIGTVLPAVPRKASGLEVDTLVVDDGSADRTSEVALGHGVYVAKLGRNSGQGSALRVGYRLAREHGARFIVTLDADGQWDPAEILPLVEPLVRDEADLVLGSRILGRAETDDSVRRAGVHVFARFLRLVTGLPITDTSTGVRAMRAEVTATVRQEEPQYQASELLIGAIYQGYRIAERPVVMRNRVAGESKKGHNVLYGFRYGRVVLRTLWRERRAASKQRSSAASGSRH